MARPAEALRRAARRLDDLDALVDLIADRRLVLIGEATHGTHEFYAIRAELTRRLIERHGFSAVAVEADWPDASRVNRYVRGSGDDTGPEEALGGFTRFPRWMWRNADVADRLDALLRHLGRRTDHPRVVVWEHNSHIGDARATEMGWRGELNVGQLARERHGNEEVALVGFTTHDGTVTAASDWDLPPRRRRVVPALPDGYERLLHETGLGDFWLWLDHGTPAAAALDDPRLERAIGVVYRPESERASHWFRAHLPTQFDAVIHVDRSTAVVPLDPFEAGEEPPETYPTAV